MERIDFTAPNLTPLFHLSRSMAQVSVCPADTVDASVEVVWRMLMAPANYGRFWDLHVEAVEPAGAAIAGQRISGWTRELCKRWKIDGEIVFVDQARHQIRFRLSLPFGVVSDNVVSCTPLGVTDCLVRFG